MYNVRFEDIIKKDIYGVYLGYRTVENAVVSGIIPEEFADVFKRSYKCKCGSDMIISNNLKNIKCCNANCYIKIGHSMAYMFQKNGIKNLGPETCIKIAKICIDNKWFKYATHTEIFNPDILSNMQYILGDSAYYNLVSAVDKILTTRWTFAKAVSTLGIPTLDSSAEDILDDFNSITDLYQMYKDGKLQDYLANKGVRDPEKMYNLVNGFGTILHLQKNMKVPFTRKGVFTRKICITGSVSVDGQYMTRNQFVEYLNTLGEVNGVQLFNVRLSTAYNQVDCVIADRPSHTTKYLRGKELGILCSAQEYVDELREEVNKWKKMKC